MKPATAPASRQRSELMSRIRQRGTSLELTVRKALLELSVPYESNATGLAGTPDIANREQKWVVFINGCFWHGHAKCQHGRPPKSNSTFWREKISANRKRDRRNISELQSDGYRVLTLWECELDNRLSLSQRLEMFLKRPLFET
jgi:DNA mismatch endonuclease (patch repair protein)